MYSGAHAPSGLFKEAAYEDFQTGGFRSVLLLDNLGEHNVDGQEIITEGVRHTGDDVAELKKLGILHRVVRLRDTVWYRPLRNPDGSFQRDADDKLVLGHEIPSPQDYGDYAAGRMMWWNKLFGVTDFALGNEDNWLWPHFYPDKGPGDWLAFFRDVFAHIRWYQRTMGPDGKPLLSPQVRVGYPPLAPSKANTEQWFLQTKALADSADCIWIHSYWQSSRTNQADALQGPMLWEQFGANAEWYHRQCPDKRIIVGEYGNSMRDEDPRPPDALIQECMRVQYPLWVAWARAQGYIDAAYLFIIYGYGWEGFYAGPEVLEALAKVA